MEPRVVHTCRGHLRGRWGRPRSWSARRRHQADRSRARRRGERDALGPHVSLHPSHARDEGQVRTLRITGVEDGVVGRKHRWVLLTLEAPSLRPLEGTLHMSCAQAPADGRTRSRR